MKYSVLTKYTNVVNLVGPYLALHMYSEGQVVIVSQRPDKYSTEQDYTDRHLHAH